jgi:dihydrofolate reductase
LLAAFFRRALAQGIPVMLLSLIVAMDQDRVIGRDNQLPWHMPADLRFFKNITLGKPIIMGRKTHESIGRPLPRRKNIVVTRNTGYQAPGCLVTSSVEGAFRLAEPAAEVMLIGGGTLFAQTLDRAGRIYLTRVHARVAGDVRFPELDPLQWHEVCREEHPADADHEFPFSFTLLERRARRT